jgi:hypothetical protein
VEVACRSYPAMLSLEGYLDPESQMSDLRGARGVFVTGCIFAMLGLMNFKNTVETILEKRAHTTLRKSASQAAMKKGT